MDILEFVKSFLLGIIEGITEWLPISSTGHMILFNEFLNNEGSFLESQLYLYVIQLGAILAVVTLFFNKLNPFSPKKTTAEKANTWKMWYKVIIACIPAGVIGLLLNDFMEKFENWQVVSAMLIVYGIAFIIVEKLVKKTTVKSIDDMSYKTALTIGAFQVLSIIPGTSRSGSTILGGMLMGCTREIAAEFSFFLAIPVMFGVSLLKIITHEGTIEWGLLLVGMIVSYIVSMVSIKFLMNYVKKHSFASFGWYRIVLGVLVIGYFLLS
ncbi:MAG: undecaprenyl-diphosphate phosphatase [Clostridia bacterium]|nr:undecaprenyl-diphosphate phosphatase [Clostridia bacterium]